MVSPPLLPVSVRKISPSLPSSIRVTAIVVDVGVPLGSVIWRSRAPKSSSSVPDTSDVSPLAESPIQ